MLVSRISYAPILCRALKQFSVGAKSVKLATPQLQLAKSSGSWTYRTGNKPTTNKNVIVAELLGACKLFGCYPSSFFIHLHTLLFRLSRESI